MMSGHEADVAQKNLTYPREGTKEERQAAREAYRARNKEITEQFRAFCEHQFAGNLSQRAKDAIWSKAWEDSHAYGYYAVEQTYDDLVAFVQEVIA